MAANKNQSNNPNTDNQGDPESDKNQNPFQPSGNTQRILFWLLIALLFGIWYLNTMDGGPFSMTTDISYTKFLDQVNDGNVERVEVKGERIRGVLQKPAQLETSSGETKSYTHFVTYSPSFGDKDLMGNLKSKGVEVITRPSTETSWWTILMFALPVLILLSFGYMFYQRMQAQGQNIFSIGQNKAKLQEGKNVKTKFEDVAGCEGAKKELKEVIGFLKNPEKFHEIGGEVPKGVLMVGPPGTGKTMLARAVAGEAEVPFFTITGSDFMEMFVGVGAKRVREMFKNAKEKSPSIIFIDEVDSIGRRRGAGLGGGHDEREQTLNQLLSELDGFEPNENVIVMAATNRPDILDKALLRPGRFDRQITVDLPSQKHRHEILKVHAKNKKIAEGVELESIAKSTPGFSGADLKNLLNEAALLATRNGHNAIHQEDVEEAKDKIMMGLKREGIVITDEEKKMLAYHEGGHALVAAYLPNTDPLHKVTIIPRGKAMGVTIQLPEREKYIYAKEYMLDRMAVMMGGRAAEELIFDTATSGAENDLKQITKLARKMVLDWGMSKKFGHMALGGEQQQVFLGKDLGQQREYSDDTAREADQEVKSILENAYKRAVETLKENREVLDRVADLLLEHEEISGKTVLNLIEKKKEGKDITEINVVEDGESEEEEEEGSTDTSPEEDGAKNDKETTISSAEDGTRPTDSQSTKEKSAAKTSSNQPEETGNPENSSSSKT